MHSLRGGERRRRLALNCTQGGEGERGGGWAEPVWLPVSRLVFRPVMGGTTYRKPGLVRLRPEIQAWG